MCKAWLLVHVTFLWIESWALNVITATHENYSQIIRDNRVVLVKYYAPWCGHCKKLAPAFEQAATELQSQSAGLVTLAKLDFTLKTNQEEVKKVTPSVIIRSFPTLLVFTNGNQEPQKYSSGRSASDIVAAMMSRVAGLQPAAETAPRQKSLPTGTATRSDKTPSDTHGALDLPDGVSQWRKFLDNSRGLLLVMWHSPACVHCTAALPQFVEAGSQLAPIAHLTIAHIDLSRAGHEAIGMHVGIKSTPTFKFYHDGLFVRDYSDYRTTEHFKRHMTELWEKLQQAQKPPTSVPETALLADPQHIGLLKYAAFHRRMVSLMRSGTPQSKTGIKFVVFQEIHSSLGFGNQVEGLISALMYAIATDRVFVMDWMRGKWLQEFEKLPIDCNIEHFRSYFAEVLDQRSLDMTLRRGKDGRNPNEGCVEPSTDWVCEDMEALHPEPVVLVRGNIYSGNLLFYNEFLKKKLEKVFGSRSLWNNPFASVFRWLFRPSKKVQRRIDAFKKRMYPLGEGARGRGDQPVVGIHMRVRDSFATEATVPLFWDCAKHYFANNTRFFLATDNPKVQKQAQQVFGKDRVLFVQPVDKSAKVIRADYEHRLMDLVLLGECDDLIVTSGSSYSRVAHARADMAPLIVTYKSHRWSTRHLEGSCVRAAHAKPCARRYHLQLNRAPCLVGSEPKLLRELFLECDHS